MIYSVFVAIYVPFYLITEEKVSSWLMMMLRTLR